MTKMNHVVGVTILFVASWMMGMSPTAQAMSCPDHLNPSNTLTRFIEFTSYTDESAAREHLKTLEHLFLSPTEIETSELSPQQLNQLILMLSNRFLNLKRSVPGEFVRAYESALVRLLQNKRISHSIPLVSFERLLGFARFRFWNPEICIQAIHVLGRRGTDHRASIAFFRNFLESTLPDELLQSPPSRNIHDAATISRIRALAEKALNLHQRRLQIHLAQTNQ